MTLKLVNKTISNSISDYLAMCNKWNDYLKIFVLS